MHTSYNTVFTGYTSSGKSTFEKIPTSYDTVLTGYKSNGNSTLDRYRPVTILYSLDTQVMVNVRYIDTDKLRYCIQWIHK